MIRTLSIVLAVILLSSCEKIFHPEEISIGTIENFEELVSATNGVYGKLAEAINNSSGKSFYSANLKGDDMNIGLANYEEYYKNDKATCWLEDISINDFYGHNDDAWKLLYQVIASTNNILVQFTPVTAQTDLIKEILGEVLFLRAYCYFRLTRTYGDIPIITDREIDYRLVTSSFAEIYAFIENDLQLAMNLLPDNNNSVRIAYVTPHRGVAKALLAEVYLSWAGYPLSDLEKYRLAAKEAEEIVDSADFFGFGLADDFAWLWDKDHYYNQESVFTIYFANPRNSTLLNGTNLVYRGWLYSNFNSPWNFLPDPETIVMLFYFPAEIQFFNNFPAGYRKEITFYTTIYVPDIPPYYPTIDTGYIHIDRLISTCSRICYRKFYLHSETVPYEQFYESSASFNCYFGDSKIYLFRYAQILLTFAEAKARSGQLGASAYEAVNRIRRRARNADPYSPSVYDLTPGLSSETFADSVVWERAWELAGEPEGRWFDLVRLEMVEELPNLRDLDDAAGPPVYPITKDVYFFSVPEEDQLLNPNLE